MYNVINIFGCILLQWEDDVDYDVLMNCFEYEDAAERQRSSHTSRPRGGIRAVQPSCGNQQPTTARSHPPDKPQHKSAQPDTDSLFSSGAWDDDDIDFDTEAATITSNRNAPPFLSGNAQSSVRSGKTERSSTAGNSSNRRGASMDISVKHEVDNRRGLRQEQSMEYEEPCDKKVKMEDDSNSRDRLGICSNSESW